MTAEERFEAQRDAISAAPLLFRRESRGVADLAELVETFLTSDRERFYDVTLPEWLDAMRLAARENRLAPDHLFNRGRLDELDPLDRSYLAATIELLSMSLGIITPAWVDDAVYVYPGEWYSGDATGAWQNYLRLVSPKPFRERNLYVTENVLTRA